MWQIVAQEGDISVSHTVMVKVEQGESDDAVKDVMVSWGLQDDALGTALLNMVENIGRWSAMASEEQRVSSAV